MARRRRRRDYPCLIRSDVNLHAIEQCILQFEFGARLELTYRTTADAAQFLYQ